ncbi:MAG: hypothetical protein HY040_10475 [Planctomycetes bacterium]|nr:hypothetical protein [Planctomycetota bacterium]
MNLTGEEKAALLLMNLAPAVTERILIQLGPDRSGRMRAAMARLQPSTELQEALDGILAELGDAMSEGRPRRSTHSSERSGSASILVFPQAEEKPPRREQTPSKPVEPAKPALSAPTSAAQTGSYAALAAVKPIALPEPDDEGAASDPLAALARLSPAKLVSCLEDESTRTVSLILNLLPVDFAGEVFKLLPAEARNAVSSEFGALVAPGMHVLKRIALALWHKSRRLKEKPPLPEGVDRYRKMADLLRLLKKPQRMEALGVLQEKDPTAANEVKNYLYQLEDVLRIEARSMQKLLMDIDSKTLAYALRGASEPIRNKFLANLSKRAQESLAEEMELAQSIGPEPVEQAQKEIVNIIQRLDMAGELVMLD